MISARLEAAYDYEAIRQSISREILRGAAARACGVIASYCPSMARRPSARWWDSRPLIKSDRLAKALGVSELYIKNDTVNYPTLSFKDRVVSVALSRARELGFQVVACASTGNLANSVAANAAAAGPEELRAHSGRPRAGQGPRARSSTEPMSSESTARTTR